MAYDFSKLRGKIIEVFGSLRAFTVAMNWSETTCYKKVNGEIFWKQDEITKAAKLLGIPNNKITLYFFTLKV